MSSTDIAAQPHTNRLADILDRPESSTLAAVVHVGLVGLIIAATSIVIIQTMPSLHGNPVFQWLEVAVTLLLTLELGLRCIVCTSFAAFVTNGFNVIDLLAVFPGYLELARLWWFSGDPAAAGEPRSLTVRMIRFLWVLRIFRLVKVARHIRLLSDFVTVLRKAWASGVAVVAVLLLFLTVLSASLLYLLESDRCEELGIGCAGFDSILAACWFVIATLTTVGYGDQIPSTVGGRIVAGLTSIVAVTVIALAVGLLSFSFAEQFNQERVRRRFVEQRRDSQEPSRECQELHELVCNFQMTCDDLVVRLNVLAKRHMGENTSPTVGVTPLLRSIEERANMLSFEIHNFVYMTLLDQAPARPCDETGGLRDEPALEAKTEVLIKSCERTYGESGL